MKNNTILTATVGAFLLLFAATVYAAPEEHLIKNLPGLNYSINFNMYSGYIQVNETHNKNLFYWFVESQRDPATDPVVLWLQGGPGGSSLYALFVEHGPFRVKEDGETLYPFEQSWNKYANVIYLESPAHVGFSYSDSQLDVVTTDEIVASENYVFIRKWLELFPEFSTNEFYISGESYAGHYIPTLAREILSNDVDKNINMRGFLIGSPYTNGDCYMQSTEKKADVWPYLTFLYSHGLVSQSAYEEAYQACGWEGYMENCDRSFVITSDECVTAVNVALKQVPTDIDVYNIDGDVCLDDNYYRFTSQWNYLTNFMEQRRKAEDAEPEVQEAIHAKSTKWSDVSILVNLGMKKSFWDNMIPLYQEFFENERSADWRILIFSGDFDAAVPFLSTQRWVKCLGRTVKNDWHNWRVNNQVAGGLIEYDKITFITVKGSGHMVPYYTPDKGLALFKRFIDNEEF